MATKNLITKCVISGALLFTAVQANAITILTDTTDTDIAPVLTGFATTGAMMDGLSVTANFDDGHSETLSWADTGATSGGVTGTGWGLSLAGDTFGANWSFVNSRGTVAPAGLTSLVLDARTGFLVFDLTFNNATGTPGSALGWDFEPNPNFNGTATYTHQVAIGAAAVVGDLWHVLTIVPDTAITDRTWAFIQDTDNDIRAIAPEPTGMALMGLGLLGLGFYRRRREIG